MTNRFAKSDATKEVEDDFVGGGGGIMPTDIYAATIKAAYETTSAKSKAVAMNFILIIDGKEVRQQIWMTNGQGGCTYKAKDGTVKNLPGYDQVNSLFMLILGKEIGQADVEELTMKLYDFDAKAEVNKAVDCYTELHGVEIQVALQQQTVDKTKLNETSGKYEPTGETRDINEVVKFFPAARRATISEVSRHIKSLGATLDDVLETGEMDKVLDDMPDEAGAYATTWLEKNQGQVYVKAKGSKKTEGKAFGGSAGKSDAPAEKKKSLFGK